MTNFNTTNLIKQVKLPGSETLYEVADAAARVAVNSIENSITTIAGQIEALSAGGLTYQIVDTLPTGEAIQQNVIYLIAEEGAVGTYVEYLAVKVGDTVSLERIGTTKTDLNEYEKAISSISIPTYEASGNTTIGKTAIVPAGAAVDVATVTSEGSAGTASSWAFGVSNGILEISGSNSVVPTMPVFGTQSVATVGTAVENVATIAAEASVVTGIHKSGTENATINH